MTTMRRVLEELKEAGLLRVEHGLGTYVADLGQEHDFALSSFSEDLAVKNLAARTRLVFVETATIHRAAAEALNLTEDSTVVALIRVRLLGDVPIVYQRSYLSAEYSSAFRSYDAEMPLYAFVRDHLGLVATVYRESLSACTLPDEVAGHLHAKCGAPAIFSRKTSHADGGEPFLYDEAFMPSNRIEVVVHRSGNRYGVEYLPAPLEDLSPAGNPEAGGER